MVRGLKTVALATFATVAGLSASPESVTAQGLSNFGYWEDTQGYGRGDWRRSDRGRTWRRDRYDRYDRYNDDDIDDDVQARRRSQPTLSDRVASGGAKPTIIAKTPPRMAFNASYQPGSIVIDVSARKLYFVTQGAKALVYPIGVGREGFSWTGTERVSRVADWPDWNPPEEMRRRQPKLPAKMTGGIRNPLGARAIYLGNTLYRIHGTNDASSIGTAQSSGCFRMLNEHVADLVERVAIGAEVHVVGSLGAKTVASRTESRTERPRSQPRTVRLRVDDDYDEDDRRIDAYDDVEPAFDDRYDDPYDERSWRRRRAY